MLKTKRYFSQIGLIIPKFFRILLNISLVIMALMLSYLLVKELFILGQIIIEGETFEHQPFLASVLTFFLYFEFIAMIVKYFKENYHFPLRYFVYIGITAMLRLIIVEHNEALDTLLYALVILILIIGYFIINITPRERPKSSDDLRQHLGKK